MVELPPCGYKVFELSHGEAPAADNVCRLRSNYPTTGFGISSFKRRTAGPLVGSRRPGRHQRYQRHLGPWYSGVSGRRSAGPHFESSSVVEDGPLTRITRHRARWQDSEIVLNIRQIAGMDFVELQFVIDWRQREQMLKLEIPTALERRQVFAKVPGAVLERRTNGEEEPYQDWAPSRARSASADYTVALINNSTYSYDCLDGLFRTVLIRSAPFARHNPNQVPRDDDNAWQDQGRQERTFWLLGGKGSVYATGVRPPCRGTADARRHVMDSAHPGHLPWQQSFLEVMPENVQVLAIKRAESHATAHHPTSGTIRIATQAALRSNPLGLDQQVALRPWELKTVIVERHEGSKTELREITSIETPPTR